jgi:hypothetical protein
MVVQRKQCTILTPGVSVEVTPTAGNLFITILINMTHIKNENSLTAQNSAVQTALVHDTDCPAEIQPILAFLKENQLPVVIMVNIVNNNQSISNVTQSTIAGCNICGDYNTFVDGDNNIVGNNTNGGSINGKSCLK